MKVKIRAILYTIILIVFASLVVISVFGVEGIYKAISGSECFQTVRYTNTSDAGDPYTTGTCTYNVTNQSDFTSVAAGSMTYKTNGFYQYDCSGLNDGIYLMFVECNETTTSDYNYMLIEFAIDNELSNELSNVNSTLLTAISSANSTDEIVNVNSTLFTAINNTNRTIYYKLINGSLVINETQIEKAVWFGTNYWHSCNVAP